ncbi:MAG TPA: DUF815 domain-containing protein, partial [Rhizomicrobium sp.]|nr:DUF815 domain-containing protein [Rhizomicrobium sp.]
MSKNNEISSLADPSALERIAAALERMAPPPMAQKLPAGSAFVWEPAQGGLVAVPHVAHVDLSLLKGIESQREILLANTRHFAQGLP